VPWHAANQLGRDWCAQGADVQFFTNEQPPFLNKAVINHALPMLVDGERAMQWIADRFNGIRRRIAAGSSESGALTDRRRRVPRRIRGKAGHSTRLAACSSSSRESTAQASGR